MENLKLYKDIVQGMNSRGRIFYLSLGVKFKDITEKEAGYILTDILRDENRKSGELR